MLSDLSVEVVKYFHSYMYLYRTNSDKNSPIVLYEYQPDRAAKGAKGFLEGKTYCDKLFAIERKLDECTIEERQEKRQKLAKPILEDFLAWLKKSESLPKSALGKAVHYALGQWRYLENYLVVNGTNYYPLLI